MKKKEKNVSKKTPLFSTPFRKFFLDFESPLDEILNLSSFGRNCIIIFLLIHDKTKNEFYPVTRLLKCKILYCL